MNTKLSMGIIRRKLETNSILSYSSTGKMMDECNIEAIELYEECRTPHQNVLYFLGTKDFSAGEYNPKGLFLISSRPLSDSVRNQNIVLELDSKQSDLQIYNQLQHIFFTYHNLESQILHGVAIHTGIQNMIDIITPFLENEIIVMDANYHIVAHSYEKIQLLELAYLPQPDSAGFIPSELGNYFSNDLVYKNVSNEKKLFYYEPSIFRNRVLCKNIFFRDEYVRRIVLCQIHKQIDSWDERLFNWFCEYLQILYSQNDDSLEYNVPESLSGTIWDLLTGQYVWEEDVEKILHRNGWKKEDPYICFCLVEKSYADEKNSLDYHSSKITALFDDTICFNYQHALIGVVNLSKYKSIDAFTKGMSVYQREANLQAGYSNVYKNIMAIPMMLKQAQIALRNGISENSSIWTHHFQRYVFLYLQKKMTDELPGEFLAADEVLKLQYYDKENGSAYIKTLQSYIANNLNAVKTAADLYIHRATMVYRLNRIKEIGNIDFTNNKQLLHIRMTFAFFYNE